MRLRKKIPIILSPFFALKNGDIFLIAEIWEKVLTNVSIRDRL